MAFGKEKSTEEWNEVPEEAVELDEEGGPIVMDHSGEQVIDNDNDAGDEASEAPPPPPPPPFLLDPNKPSSAMNSANIHNANNTNNDEDDGESGAKTSRKKKLIIGGVVALAACLALGLGLGLGLKGDSSSSSENTNASAATGGGEVGSEKAVDALGAGGGGGEADDVEAEAVNTVALDAEVSATSSSPADGGSMDWEEVASLSTEAATTAAPVTTMAAEEVVATTDAATTVAPTTEAAEDTATTATEAPPTEPVTTEPAGPVEPTETYDAVVIGAGWAGIRATQTLLNEGITSILVLEASDYVGGRAKSINADYGDNSDETTINNPNALPATNVPYDMGCEWLYNTGSEMEVTLVEGGYLDGMLDNDKYTGIPLETGTFYQQAIGEESGEVETKVLEDSYDWMERIWGGFIQFRERLDDRDKLDDMSYAEAIDQYIETADFDEQSIQFLNMMEDNLEAEYTGESSQISAEEIEFFPMGYSLKTHYMSVPGFGFGNIAARYAQPFEDYIKLNSKVTDVDSTEEDGIPVVRYTDENSKNQAVKAKTVLVTVSLGVLKAGTINFIPSFPSWKQNSIDAMGFGVVNKCMMTWNNDEDYVWPKDKLWYFLITPEDETSGSWTSFWNPSNLKGVPSLTAWAGGAEAVAAEKQTDDEILDTVMGNLRAMFPSIRPPDNVIISRWGQDENVRGTYSFPVPGRDHGDDRDDLAKRLGRIYFAGEATGGGWATTMGAWNTGQDAAEDMAKRLLDQ